MNTRIALSRLLLPVLTLLLAGFAPPVAAQESLALRFGWPVGEARVTMSSSTVVESDMMNSSMDSEMSFTIALAEHPEGIVVRYSDYDFGEGLGLPGLAASNIDPEQLAEIAQAMQYANADIVITDDGRFVRMADENSMDAMMQALDRMFEELIGDQAIPQFEEMRGQLSDPDVWEQQTRQAWDVQVDQWRGDWVIGEPKLRTTTFPLPIGTEPLELEQELVVESSGPCPDGTGSCLTLVARNVSDDGFESALREMIAEMLGEMAGSISFEIIEVDMDTETRSIVDAATLRPIRQETVTSIFQVLGMMGSEMASSNLQTVTTTWDWGN